MRLSSVQGSTVSPSATFFDLNPIDSYANNNVETVTNALTSGRTQNFTYDNLNRIVTAQSTATSGVYCWGQSIPTNGTGYDRYGNLLTVNTSQCSSPPLSVSVNAYNQITNTGFSYDLSGDMLTDGTDTYTWNGEMRLNSAASLTYTYDGEGKRVEKSRGTYYWRDRSGTVLAETNTSGATQNEYIYFNGARIARHDSTTHVYYYFSDQIGTAQLISNSTGTVCYDSDSTPFGYQMVYTSTCTQEFNFAGMQLDSETGNYDTWHRYYQPNLGRWMSPDRKRGNASNPQSLNRYAYVLNNPTNLTDPLGLEWCPQGSQIYENGILMGYQDELCMTDSEYQQSMAMGWLYVDSTNVSITGSPDGFGEDNSSNSSDDSDGMSSQSSDPGGTSGGQGASANEGTQQAPPQQPKQKLTDAQCNQMNDALNQMTDIADIWLFVQGTGFPTASFLEGYAMAKANEYINNMVCGGPEVHTP